MKERPTTAGGSSSLISAPTAASNNQLGHSGSIAGSLAEKARAISLSRFSHFDETEKAVRKYNFPSFYTKAIGAETYDKTEFHKENRFEAKTNYMVHKSSGLVVEQEMDKYFMDLAHKELQEKRRDEEGKEMVREWGMARGRVESEIARKKEHINDATNFKDARAWVRSNWKTKKHDHRTETMSDFLQITSSSEGEEELPMESSRAHSLKNSARGLNR